MIRKPDARDFRESDAVLAIRDAGTLAVEGARGVGQGTAQFVRGGLLLLFGFGFVMSVVSHLGPAGLLLGGAGIVAFVIQRSRKRTARDNAARWSAPSELRAREPAAAIEPARYDLSVGATGRTAAMIAVPAILFFPTSSLFSFMLPLTFGAVVALALSFLIMARLTGDRMVVRYDAETLTVRGLLGEDSILWEDVGDVIIRKASFFNLKVLFTSGSRRNLVVLGRRNRLGGADTLYVPIDLLGLDQDALAKLVGRFILLQAGAPLPDAIGGVAPTRARPRPLEPDPVAFDPDAIIARHLAEREASIAAHRPAVHGPPRPAFGRKLI